MHQRLANLRLALLPMAVASMALAAPALANDRGGDGQSDCRQQSGQAEGASLRFITHEGEPGEPPLPPGGPGKPPGDDQGGDQGAGPDRPDDHGGRQGQEDGGDQGRQCGLKNGFLNKIWKFAGDADSYSDGVLNMTIAKMPGLPKKFKDQDDDLLGEDAFVLVGENTKVSDSDGNRIANDDVDAALGKADKVSVKGKLLRPSKWREDQDGAPTPTIRAKRIAITG